jgi:hypothetical protein
MKERCSACVKAWRLLTLEKPSYYGPAPSFHSARLEHAAASSMDEEIYWFGFMGFMGGDNAWAWCMSSLAHVVCTAAHLIPCNLAPVLLTYGIHMPA